MKRRDLVITYTLKYKRFFGLDCKEKGEKKTVCKAINFLSFFFTHSSPFSSFFRNPFRHNHHRRQNDILKD